MIIKLKMIKLEIICVLFANIQVVVVSNRTWKFLVILFSEVNIVYDCLCLWFGLWFMIHTIYAYVSIFYLLKCRHTTVFTVQYNEDLLIHTNLSLFRNRCTLIYLNNSVWLRFELFSIFFIRNTTTINVLLHIFLHICLIIFLV